ncbi:MAG: hypothetical protein GY816_14190, partial [Cytophagales bacterium]|nr:hypothetical protein [Cytophagales bacterium]
MKSSSGQQDEAAWGLQIKLDQIPSMGNYGLIPPPKFPQGVSEAEGHTQWFKMAQASHPEWYVGVHMEDANPEWSRLFGAKLKMDMEYNEIVAQGKLGIET